MTALLNAPPIHLVCSVLGEEEIAAAVSVLRGEPTPNCGRGTSNTHAVQPRPST
ncbi:hypothetical protein ACGFIV_24425 [Sphaerisporangium sp. NPDC049003]|uniref:hypothetical protein n=1 Tax=Sphaerisporangium sp. NPDC049003 TaxID=3364517 RepID=UPI003723320B